MNRTIYDVLDDLRFASLDERDKGDRFERLIKGFLEVEDPRYIVDLIARVVTVSVQTVAIVDALPALDVLESAAEAAPV